MAYTAVLVVVLLLAGAGLWWWGRTTRQSTGLPAGEVVYSDTGAEQAVLEPLMSRRFGLVGKPDYLVEVRSGTSKTITPLEVKSRRRPSQPNAGHVLQLATYCLIVEDLYGKRPPHGYLRYADATLKIPFTDALRGEVLRSAQEIRKSRAAANVARSHGDPWRCRSCGYVESCGAESLAPAPRTPSATAANQ